jgi:hypothetical protein
MSRYRLELIGVDGEAADEEHELVEATGQGLRIVDGDRETGIPWGVIHVYAITPLDVDVRQPTVRQVPRRPNRRKAP